ncbi:golgin subfamily A member 4 like protein [Danaus plexippus plexippus]|uniref:Golgin subfamily A member 4 like protein n=1 Tax=Danaus plexippus plexippus TaxID=278856 RepID=A0A212FAN7_DANPL|nr:golgin subfamily A member 4 like protein [Danaus plexippus plexippus]
MFKKFKDKLAEEVKSSPQRIQQFAQAAQAAVTSASSSISDITNNDLFSIGDNDASNKNRIPSNSQQGSFHEVPLSHTGAIQPNILLDYSPNHEGNMDSSRQRRLSNSSFASDISFRLPSYESPSMYHLQSDMEVSASEAEDKGFPGETVNLDRVTKEQLYSAYRRTQDRCTKYKTQYSDLARHYKLLERENAKARNVLVETQDKALRRISELREQCSLEQSAKAHLEKALRIEIEEKNMKIDTLNTQLNYLKSNNNPNEEQVIQSNAEKIKEKSDNEALLINLSTDSNENKATDEPVASEVTVLNNKIEKMEQLISKYKDSLKTTKEKNAQLTTELQIISTELESKVKENDQLKAATVSLTEARKKIQELNEKIEDLENKNNTYEFSKQKEISILELNFKNAQEEIQKLQENVQILSKREEEYAISLAENKLSIHKELEDKEKEIKSLKDSLETSQKEIQSLNILSNEFKNNIKQLEEERLKLKDEINILNVDKTKVEGFKLDLENLAQKCQALENVNSKSEEEYKCLQLQLKQETAEKLAMIDRNTYLENRNKLLLEENTKKSTKIKELEKEIQTLESNLETSLESEIQEERVELIKLQSEIEKLLTNYELVQNHNIELKSKIEELVSENVLLNQKAVKIEQMKENCKDLEKKVSHLRKLINMSLDESNMLKKFINKHFQILKDKMMLLDEALKNDTASSKMSDDLKETNQSLLLQIKTISDQFKSVSDELKQRVTENDNLKVKLNQAESDLNLHVQNIDILKNENQTVLNKLSVLIKESESFNDNLMKCREETAATIKERDQAKEEKEEVNKKLSHHIKENESLKDQVNKINNLYKNAVEKLDALNKEIDDLRDMKLNYKEKCNSTVTLQKRIDELTQENASLKKMSETIASALEGIESELKDVRNSHTEIEMEKDHLNSIIEKLEKKADVLNHDTQTDHCNDKELLEQEIKDLKEANEILSHENEQQKITISNTDDILSKLNDVMNNYDVLREEKRRLQSDIEGLQTHLTKVSKENSNLNDRLRELIASSDNVNDKSEKSSYELQCLMDEVKAGQEKIENLIRENTLLAEENLELKDQINTQTTDKTSVMNDSNKYIGSDNVMEKINDLLDTKKTLEKEVTDLKLINQSVSGNMQQVQANNEKLRLSNDKLERRLDEALVSLRHLHSLQENTELEYLKNILYEYLTGSGTHSITLAKVLAAVVKFDDRQTEAVLQKEKERQGFLRQLGII